MQKDLKDLVVRLVYLELMVAGESPEWLDLLDLVESPEYKDLKERKERMVASSMSMDHLDQLDLQDLKAVKESVGRKAVPDLSSLDHKDHQEIRVKKDDQDAKENLGAKDQSEREDLKEIVSTVPFLVLLLGIKVEPRGSKHSTVFSLFGDVQ